MDGKLGVHLQSKEIDTLAAMTKSLEKQIKRITGLNETDELITTQPISEPIIFKQMRNDLNKYLLMLKEHVDDFQIGKDLLND